MAGEGLTFRDKVGLVILVLLFVVLFAVLWFTLKPYGPESRSPEESVIIQQRMRNLEKSR